MKVYIMDLIFFNFEFQMTFLRKIATLVQEIIRDMSTDKNSRIIFLLYKMFDNKLNKHI